MQEVHGAQLLKDLFGQLSERRVAYDKVRHGLELTRWILEQHSPCPGSASAQSLSSNRTSNEQAMLSAYFDNCVYSETAATANSKIKADELVGLKAALTSGKLVVRMSIADIEEQLGDLDKSPKMAVERLRAARNLVGFQGMLKQPRDLLADAVRAYVDGTQPPAVTLSEPERRGLVFNYLSPLLAGKASTIRFALEVLSDVRAQKTQFFESMAEARPLTLDLLNWKALNAKDRKGKDFDFFWKGAAHHWAGWVADGAGGDLGQAARERGLEGLLAVPAVRLSVMTALGQIYSQEVLGRAARPSDGYDLWHATLGSAADVFVTSDGDFADHLQRIPLDGFRVVRSIGELLLLV